MEMAARRFDADERETWRVILHEHARVRDGQICALFLEGVRILGLDEDRIPDLGEINRILQARSGFRGVFVEGLADAATFYAMLARGEFPVGNFIRDRADLGYTPAPDIVHDLYGHLPFYTDRAYGDFCRAIGAAAIQYADRPTLLRQYERFFWFTIEFGLVKTPAGIRVFGAGIASSVGECAYALSGKPKVLPFDVDVIRHQEFRIDEMQPTLFLLESADQLYQSLEELGRRVKKDA